MNTEAEIIEKGLGYMWEREDLRFPHGMDPGMTFGTKLDITSREGWNVYRWNPPGNFELWDPHGHIDENASDKPDWQDLQMAAQKYDLLRETSNAPFANAISYAKSYLNATLDIALAQEIKRDMIREERTMAWRDADADWFKAMDQGLQANITVAAAKRQKLRDAPAHPRITAADTIGKLNAVTLGSLMT